MQDLHFIFLGPVTVLITKKIVKIIQQNLTPHVMNTVYYSIRGTQIM